MGRTFTDLTDRSHSSHSSSDSGRSNRPFKKLLSRITSDRSSRKGSIAKDRKISEPPTATEDKHENHEDGFDDLPEEKDAWQNQTVLKLGDGQQSHPISQLLILKALMTEITRLEKNSDANSSFDSPLIFSRRHTKQINVDTVAVSSGKMDNFEDAGYKPCHYFDFVGGASTSMLIAILLGRLSMTVDQAIAKYKELASFRERNILPIKRRASNNEREFRSCVDSTIKESKVRPRHTMVKEAPNSTKIASNPYMCKTFLNPNTGSTIDLSSCKTQDWLGEEITNAVYHALNGQKAQMLRNMPLKRKRKTNRLESEFLMSIGRISPREENDPQKEEIRTVGKFYKKDVPSFLNSDDFLSPDKDVLSFLEENQSTDKRVKSLLMQIRKCAQYLVEKRQRRAQTEDWERFALGTDYRCGYCPADNRQHPYNQYLLIEHLQKEHRAPPSDEDRFDTYCEILRHFRTEAVAW